MNRTFRKIKEKAICNFVIKNRRYDIKKLELICFIHSESFFNVDVSAALPTLVNYVWFYATINICI